MWDFVIYQYSMKCMGSFKKCTYGVESTVLLFSSFCLQLHNATLKQTIDINTEKINSLTEMVEGQQTSLQERDTQIYQLQESLNGMTVHASNLEAQLYEVYFEFHLSSTMDFFAPGLFIILKWHLLCL